MNGQLPIAQIIVDERRRQDIGDIDELAASIERYGLLHPLVIDADHRLVAGGRRLLACLRLGWREIDVRMLGELNDSELREIELEENLRRKDLSEYERSRVMGSRVQLVTEKMLAERFSSAADENPRSGGRPPKVDSLENIADRLGVSHSTLSRAQAHVETAEAFPFMQRWKQYEVLEARESLTQLPEPERPKLAALLDQPGIPPRDAIAVVRNVAAKPADERERIYTLAVSADSRDRSDALAAAAEVPPMPDPRLALLDDAGRALRMAERMFPGDPANPSIATVRRELKAACAAVEGVTRGTR